jgi:hypothetical protein
MTVLWGVEAKVVGVGSTGDEDWEKKSDGEDD